MSRGCVKFFGRRNAEQTKKAILSSERTAVHMKLVRILDIGEGGLFFVIFIQRLKEPLYGSPRTIDVVALFALRHQNVARFPHVLAGEH